MFDRRLITHFEWPLFLLTLTLLGVGVLAVYSATYTGGPRLNPTLVRQLIWIGIGSLGMALAFGIDYHRFENWAYPLYLCTFLLLLLVPLIGSVGGGARRWIVFGPLSLQPSEFAKISLLLVLARFFHRYTPQDGYGLRDLVYPTVLVLIPAALVLLQPNLGTAVSFGLLFVCLTFAAGLRWGSFALLGVISGGILSLLWFFVMEPYQKERVLSFLDPGRDPLGTGYHVVQSKISVGSGMLWGKGFLQSTQSRLDFLPETHTDFVFAVFAEEWGFVGAAGLLILYGLILTRLLMIAWRARERFGALLAVGVAALVFWPTLFNIGMNIGVLPVVGIPLPLVSYGGSSLLTVMLVMGLALNVSTRRAIF